VLRDGRTLSAELEIPLGHPDRPLSDGQLRAKFLDCAARARRALPAGEAEAIADRLMALEGERDIAALIGKM
jgi:hypothetical protein